MGKNGQRLMFDADQMVFIMYSDSTALVDRLPIKVLIRPRNTRRISVSEIETERWREGVPLPLFLKKALSYQNTGLGCPPPPKRLYQAGTPHDNAILLSPKGCA